MWKLFKLWGTTRDGKNVIIFIWNIHWGFVWWYAFDLETGRSIKYLNVDQIIWIKWEAKAANSIWNIFHIELAAFASHLIQIIWSTFKYLIDLPVSRSKAYHHTNPQCIFQIKIMTFFPSLVVPQSLKSFHIICKHSRRGMY